MTAAVKHVQPRCEKVLSQTDTKKLAFPAGIRGHVWGPTDPHGTVRIFRVVDSHGTEWEICGRLRIDGEGNRKPEVAGAGWARFVRDKGLRPLDKLVFYRAPWNVGPLFGVAVRKRMDPTVELFGIIVQVPAYFEQYDVED